MTKYDFFVHHKVPVTYQIQSLNVIECPELRAIFLMLREELQDSDIPHRATIRRRITQLWEEQLETVAAEMKVCIRHTA